MPTARFPCFRQPVLLNAGDHLLAFLDDLYVVAKPDRITAIYGIISEELYS